MSALIGALRVSLSADTTAFEAGMKRSQRTAQNTATGIQKSLGGVRGALAAGVAGFVGGLSIGAIVQAGKAALEYAGSLAEVSQQLGVTSRDLQLFRFAAGQVGISQEGLETGLSKLTITLGKVAAGAKAPAAALNAIGISVDQVRGKDTGAAFRIIADGLSKVTDRAQRAAVEVALFGKSGAQLDNLLAEGGGAIDNLTAAAEKLGLVLSDEQIQRADETADKLAAMQTVMKANIAGAVANNADAILGLASALATLIGSIGRAVQGYRILVAEFSVPLHWNQNPLHTMGMAGRAVKFRDRIMAMGAPAPAITAASGGADIGKFLAGGGGSRKAKADHSAEELQRKQLEELRRAYDAQQDEFRAQQDILEAKKDLATDYVAQTTLGVKILDSQRDQYQAELAYQVQQFEISKGQDGINQAQADKLMALYDESDALKRQKLLRDEEMSRREDVAHLQEVDFDIQRDALAAQADAATTAAERRDAELRLLELAKEQERIALERIQADETATAAAKEEARRRLLALDAKYQAQAAGVMRGTRGPLEEWAATVPQTASQITEAIQSIEARGLDSLSDAIADVVTGTKSLGDAFKEISSQIIADIVRMTVKMLIFRALSSAFGGLFGGGGSSDIGSSFLFSDTPGFDSGGSFSIMGRRGTDRNVLALNGLPIARVSHGERVSVGNGGIGNGRTQVEILLRDEMLDARIHNGAGQVVIAAAPAIIGKAREAVGRSAGRPRL